MRYGQCEQRSQYDAAYDLRLAAGADELVVSDEPVSGVEALLDSAVLVAFEAAGTETGCTAAAGAGAAGAGAEVDVVEDEPAAAAEVPSLRHDWSPPLSTVMVLL